MDITTPHSVREQRPKQRLRLRLFPDIKLITWLFSLATRAVLLSILLGVLGFLALFVYFLFGHTWGMPVVLSAGHERVIRVQNDWLERSLKLADLDSRLQVLRRQLLEVENSTEIARITAVAEANTIRSDARQNYLEIQVVKDAIAREANEHRNASNLLLQIEQLPNLKEGFEKGLVNRARFLSDMLAKTDLSIKIAALDTTLAENTARLMALEYRRDSLRHTQAIVEGKPAEQISHRELEHLKAWNEAKLKLRTGADEVQHLRQSLEQLKTLRTELLNSLRPLANSPLLLAAHEPAVVMFVPYDNVATYKPSQPIYYCRLGLVLCSPIGTIGPFIDGEVTLPHPFFQRVIRGNFYSVELGTDTQAAQNLLLFSARPLLF